jgi:ketosteroid isomerase-like protein
VTADGVTADGVPAGGVTAGGVTGGEGDDETSVRTWLEGWGSEVAAADVAAGRHRFAPDVVAFGTHADVVRGRAEVEARQWSQIWPAIEDFAFDLDDLVVIVSPDRLQAVAVVPWTSTGIGPDGDRFARPGRATIVLTRPAADEAWTGRHTHFSLARGVPAASHGRRSLRS